MGRNRIDESEKKERVSISMPKWMADKLKSNENFSKIVVDLLHKIYKKE